MVDKLKHLKEWQDNIGDCRIGPGLSYQCEIEQVVSDTYDEGFEEGFKAAYKQMAISDMEIALNNRK